MNGSNFSPWDSAEFLTNDETVIEYLRAALEESDPLIFLKAARNVARVRGMSSHELPAGASGLSPALEEEIRQILGPEVSEDFPGWRVLEDIEPAQGRKPSASAAASLGLRGNSSSTWAWPSALSAPMSASRNLARNDPEPGDNYETELSRGIRRDRTTAMPLR